MKLWSSILSGIVISLFLITNAYSQEVPDSPTKVNPILINSEIPDVSLKTLDNEMVKLRSVVAEKPTILVFYRGGWCPYCSRHMTELQKFEKDIVGMGYQILAISVDRPEVLKKTISENELSYTLLSDSPANVLKAFGIAFKVDAATVERYKNIGLDLEENSGYDHHILPAPAVYIVGTDGIVDFQYVNPNYRERIDGDILFAAAKAYL